MTGKRQFFTPMALPAILFSAVLLFSLSACGNSAVKETAAGQAEASGENWEVRELSAVNGEMTIYGKIYLPKSESKNLPAVILSHSAGLNADSLNSYCIGFAERGFAAYAFDFCGGSSNSRSDGDEEDMTIFTEVEDLKAVISQIKSLGFVDTDRIYLFGTSQGGLVSALTADDCNDEIAGLILLYPAFNIPELAQNSSDSESLINLFDSIDWSDMISNIDWSKIDWSSIHFSFPKTANGEAFINTLADFDVYENIGKFKGNVLILHGSSDIIVNKSYSERAKEKYENCELHILSGAMHGFNKDNYAFADYDEEVWEYIDDYLASENK